MVIIEFIKYFLYNEINCQNQMKNMVLNMLVIYDLGLLLF
jgi:hypothetical protein